MPPKKVKPEKNTKKTRGSRKKIVKIFKKVNKNVKQKPKPKKVDLSLLKTSTGEETKNLFILDFNTSLKRRVSAKNTPAQNKRLKKVKKLREEEKQHNIRVAGTKKREWIRRYKEIRYKRGPEAKKERARLKKNIKNPPFPYHKYDLKLRDNEINRITKKDFYYTVQDGFSKPYKIKYSDLVKKKDIAVFLLERFKKGVKKDIEKRKKEDKKGKIKFSKKLKYGLEKLIMRIDYNIKLVKLGIKTYDEGEAKIGELPKTDPPILIDFEYSNIQIGG